MLNLRFISVVCLLLINAIFASRLGAQFTNGYFHNTYDDYVALTKKLDAAGYVQASTTNQGGNADVRLMKFDGVGNVLADVTIGTLATNEFATGIVRGNSNTYVVCGYEHVGSLDLGFVMSVDTSFNVLNKVILNVQAANRHTPALNIINSAFYDKPTFGQYWNGDPNGGYLISGFEAVGYNATDSKSAYVLKLSDGLAIQWVRKFDSPISVGTADWDMSNSAGWIWTGSNGYFIGGSGTAPTGEQASLSARLDINGNVIWQQLYSDNNVSGSWCLSTDCAYDDAEFELYQLANYSQPQSGGIVAFNELTGAINPARTRYLVSNLNDYYNYEFAATCAGAEIIISGYGLNQVSGSITGTFPYAIRYNKNFPMVDVSWQHYAYPLQSANYTPSGSIFSTYSTSEQPRIYYPKLFASRQVNYLAMSAYEDNGAFHELHVVEPFFDGKDSCEYIDPQIVAVPLNTYTDIVNSVLVTYTVSPGSGTPATQSATQNPCFDCLVDPNFTFTTGTSCCYTFTANQANLCPIWTIYDVSNNIVATGSGISLTHCFLNNGTYTVEYCDCGLTNMGIICRKCTQQTITVNCPTTCTPSNSDYTYTITGCTVNFTDLTPDGDPDGCEYWVLGNLGTVSAVDFLTYTFPSSGTYNVCHYDCCRMGANSPPIYTSTCYQITVNCTPPCCLPTDFNVTGGGCCRTFTPTYPVGCTNYPFSFYWNFGDGNTSTLPNPTHCYNGNGYYNVCLTVYCSKSSKTTICKNVKVKLCAWLPPPPCCTGTSKITYSSSGLMISSGSITLLDASSVVTGYEWDWGDGTTSTGADASHYYNQGGTYTITLTTLVEGNGQTGALVSTETITIQPTPACNCTPQPPAAYTGTPMVCDEDGLVSLRILMTDEPADITYQWQRLNSGGLFEDMPGEVGQVRWISGITETSTFRCRATWNATGAVAYSEDVVVVYGYFDGTATASPPNVCSGVSSTLSVNAPDAINYDWTPNTSTSATASVLPSVTTTYGVLMENAMGCGQSATVQVVVDPCVAPSNNDFGNAILAPSTGSAYPSGNCYNGTLQFASVSAEGNPLNVLPAGGQDAWYAFTALSSASRIVCTTTSMDVVLELHTSGGAEVDMENAVSTLNQGEIMITTGLIPGQTYYVAVRSFNGITGPYSVCIQNLSFSGCSDGSGTYDLCSNFKPSWSGAASYTFHFFPTGITPGSPTSATAASQIPLSTAALALRHEGTYDVRVDGNFNFLDAAGNNESITLQGNTLCQVTIAPHADLRTKISQRCPATVLKGTWLQAKPFVCAAISHTIEFQEVSDCNASTTLGPLFTTTTSGPSSTKWLQQVGGIQSGKWYTVRWRPNFAYGPGSYGTMDVIQVGGSSETESEYSDSDTWPDELNADVAIYPNPNDGEAVFINLTDVEVPMVDVTVIDGLGKVICKHAYATNGSLNTLLQFDRPLASGIYLIEIRLGNEIITEKMIVH